jgi:glycosyltransferase involved in cell wall biosynthesis
MHIAIVTPYLPDPPNTGGRIRIARLAAALAREGALHLFSAVTEDDEGAEMRRGGRPFEPYARVLTHVVQPPETRPWREGPALARRFPEALARALGAAHDARPFDAVVVAHTYAGLGLRQVHGTTVVLDEHEVQSDVARRLLSSRGTSLARGAVDIQRWQSFERTIWSRVDAITVSRAEDAARVHAERPDTGLVVPNGVDAQGLGYRPPSHRKGNTVLFVGNMAHRANQEAAKVLALEVLPRVRRRVPGASLTIAGRSPTREVRSLEADEVRVTGTLLSLAPLYQDHVVFAVPPIPGQAMSLKILEPLSCGMPLVGPPSFARDLPLETGTHYLAARDMREVAGQVVQVLQRREAFDAMALAAKRVAERLDWEIVGERFARAMMAAIARRVGGVEVTRAEALRGRPGQLS